jgi:hypothetical protein
LLCRMENAEDVVQVPLGTPAPLIVAAI